MTTKKDYEIIKTIENGVEIVKIVYTKEKPQEK